MDKGFLKRSVIYQAFVRNETEEGTIRAFLPFLSSIEELGADILYLLPVQKIGKVGRKGSLGSPYAIQDYEQINPELGSWEDYRALVDEAHHRGLKVMQDIVYNHMSRDSVYLLKHPEWFYRDERGNVANRIGDWSDVIDLDHRAEGLDDELIRILEEFQRIGVDGFRFDAASLILPTFFAKAKGRLGHGMIFLAECVDTPFLLQARGRGIPAWSNGELAAAGMDLFYPYGSRLAWDMYRQSEFSPSNLNAFKIALSLEEANLPKDVYVTMAIENHDRDRIASYSDDPIVVRNIQAFSFFNRGPAFVYSGEEFGEKRLPSLFDKDVIPLKKGGEKTRGFFQKLIRWKRRKENEDLLSTSYPLTKDDYLLLVNHARKGEGYGLFAFDGKRHKVSPREVPIGSYVDELSEERIDVGEEGLRFREPRYLRRMG